MAAAGVGHEEEDLLLARRRRLCLSGAVDVTAAPAAT